MQTVKVSRCDSGFDIGTLLLLERYFAVPALMLSLWAGVYVDPWAPLKILASTLGLHLLLLAVRWFDRQENQENYELSDHGICRRDNNVTIPWNTVALASFVYEINDALVGSRQVAIRLIGLRGEELMVIRPGHLTRRGRDIYIYLGRKLGAVYDRQLSELHKQDQLVARSGKYALALTDSDLIITRRGTKQVIPVNSIRAFRWIPVATSGHPRDRLLICHARGEFSVDDLSHGAQLLHHALRLRIPQKADPDWESDEQARIDQLVETMQAQALMLAFASAGLITFLGMFLYFAPQYVQVQDLKAMAVDGGIILIGVIITASLARNDWRAYCAARGEFSLLRAALRRRDLPPAGIHARPVEQPQPSYAMVRGGHWPGYSALGACGLSFMAAMLVSCTPNEISLSMKLVAVAVLVGLGWIPALMALNLGRRGQSSRLMDVIERRRHENVDKIAEGICVIAIPRAKWELPQLFPEVDVGVLYVDHRQRRLVHEGADERFVLPFAAIVSWDVERMCGRQPGSFGLVLRARVEGETFWERPFQVGTGGLRETQSVRDILIGQLGEGGAY